MESEFVDVARWIIMGMGVALIGFSGAIIQMARRFRAPSIHVYLIAISYMILVGHSLVEIHARLGDDFSNRVIVGFFAYGFGWYSMWEMYKFYRPKNRALRHGLIATERAAELLDEVKVQLVEETTLTEDEVSEMKEQL